MSKADDFYDEAMEEWAASPRKWQIVGFRDDMGHVERWHDYCAKYKPIRYREYLQLIVRVENGEIPPGSI